MSGNCWSFPPPPLLLWSSVTFVLAFVGELTLDSLGDLIDTIKQKSRGKHRFSLWAYASFILEEKKSK